MSFLKPSVPNIPAPQQPALPPILAQEEAPQGVKPPRKSSQPTFLGAGDTANPTTSGATFGKTLLGQ